MQVVTKETPIKRLLSANPESAEIFMAYGLQCINCHFSEFDTIADGANIHGLNDEDIKMMIRDVNTVIGQSKHDGN